MDYAELGVLLLAIFLLIIAILLLIPFGISLRFVRTGASATGQIAVSWFGITLIRRRTLGKKKEKVGKKRIEKEQKFDWKQSARILSALRGSSQYLPILLSAFRKSISVQSLSATLTFGLDDPAETATIGGYLLSLASMVNTIPMASLSIYPSFQGVQLEGSIAAELKVRLLRIVGAFIRSYSKKPFRDLLSVMRKRRM